MLLAIQPDIQLYIKKIVKAQNWMKYFIFDVEINIIEWSSWLIPNWFHVNQMFMRLVWLSINRCYWIIIHISSSPSAFTWFHRWTQVLNPYANVNLFGIIENDQKVPNPFNATLLKCFIPCFDNSFHLNAHCSLLPAAIV